MNALVSLKKEKCVNIYRVCKKLHTFIDKSKKNFTVCKKIDTFYSVNLLPFN